MAFMSSKPWFQTPNNFITTILLTVMMTRVVLSAPTTDASSNSSGTQDLIGQVFNGLEIVIGLGSRLNGTILDIEGYQDVNISLRTVCNMYKLYAHFTTLQVMSTIQPQHALYNDYSSNLFITWRVMQLACLWAKSTDSLLPTDCNLISIANTCYSFNHQRLILQDRLAVHNAAEQPITISPAKWISKNELPQRVAEYIRNNL